MRTIKLIILMLLLLGLHTSAADKTHYKTVENIAYKTSTD